MGSKKAVKVGYRYLFGIHQGFGRGPMDEMVQIKVGGKVAWTGSVTGNQTITINKPELFGGDDGEGGIKGTMDVMMGGPDQPRNGRLAAMLGGVVPAFRGVCTAFYDGLVTSLNPYPKTWEFRWRRALAGWDGEPWYPEKAVIWLAGGTIRAMNPAHILYEAETNRDWGRKKDRSRLDDAAWRAAADQLHAEGFGLCLRWVRQDSVNAFMGHVLDHIAGNLFPSRTTGLMKLTLVRNDYDPESLPLFTPDTGLLGIDEDDNAADAGSINEIVVKWRSPIDDQVRQVRERNLAAVRSAGGDIISQTIEYLGLPTHALAGRVAVRDLQAKIGAKRWKLRLDRRAYQIEPGGVFRFSDPRRGLNNIVVRAGRIEDGTHTSGAITITALLDVFGLPATSFTTPPPSNWVPPNTTPVAAAIRRVAETTWRDLAQTIDAANLALVDPTACFIGAMAVRPTGLSLGYVIQTRVGSAAYETRAEGDFCPSGLLLAVISAEPGPTIIQLTGTEGLGQVALGSAALLDDEIVRIDAIDLGTNTLTIGRGCIDTVPAAHAAGARLWFFDDFASADPTEYSPGVTVQARLLPHTSSGSLDPVLAPTDTLVMAQRQARPYPPGRLLINTVAYPASITGTLVVAWAHRDRLLQADQLVDTTQGDIGPEAGTTYTIELYGETNALKRTVTGLTGTSYTWSTEAADSGTMDTEEPPQPRLNTSVRIRLWAVRSGLASHQVHDFTVERV